ncbi:hypothetical protein M5K25_004315 [Dendrobium thyrsiflorum]|uniref:RING-type domain-containing protein n=1 Tax=Dendrobium thyrsiflorum TaxID=117978 RepID=A0ABD0VMA6_DENTH
MSSSSTNRRLPSAGQRPRPAATNRQEWVPRSSAPLHHSDQPQPRPSRRSATDNTSVPQLVYEIQDKLSRGTVECMICYDMVRRSASMWSCPACYSIFHLHCVRKWARSPTSAADPTPTSSGIGAALGASPLSPFRRVSSPTRASVASGMIRPMIFISPPTPVGSPAASRWIEPPCRHLMEA